MKTNPSATDVTRFETAEAAVEYLKRTTFSGPSFTLNIADSFTFAGQPDTMGMGMATVVDTILAKGFWRMASNRKSATAFIGTRGRSSCPTRRSAAIR